MPYGAAEAGCGPRALLLVCDKLGVHTTLKALESAAGSIDGKTSMAGLKRAAEGLGLKASGIQAGREALPTLRTPALAWVHGNHYIAVLEMRGAGESGTVLIHDPNEADEATIAQERFLQMGGGFLLTLRR
ncbi:MAG TPA: cysteine peptidase family C39 domain-containing protein [Chloroflexota bacterium]|nr:cysteine peptidase family C39 domain-containing protein [Chloroflexota bacterium]